MGVLAALKSLPMIIGGVALLSGSIWLWSLYRTINNLEADLRHCQDRKAVMESNRDQLAAEIDTIRQRAETLNASLQAAERAQHRRSEAARAEIERLEAELADRLAAIDRTAIPETIEQRIEQCERARQVLVR